MSTSAAVSKPTITYWNSPGRAEVARLLLVDAGVDYDWNVITDWPTQKAALAAAGKIPYGQVPLYEEPGGVAIVQSQAINRYLARKHGYNGSNEQEATQIDVVNEGVGDLVTKLVEITYRAEESKKAELQAAAVRDWLPNQLTIFANFLEKNGSNGFLVGNKPSYADIHLFTALAGWKTHVAGAGDVINSNATIKNFLDSIAERPKIKAFYASNPYKKD